MGIIDKALAVADSTAQANRETARVREQNQLRAYKDDLKLRTGFEVVMDTPIQVASSSRSSLRDSWSQQRTYPPETVTRTPFLIEDVRMVKGVQRDYQDLENALVRRCQRCDRLAITPLSFPHATGPRLSQAPYSTEKECQEAFIQAVARAIVQAPVCTFCKAAEDAATCPTCHRGFGE